MPHGVADENRFEEECHIHDHAEGGDPVRSGDGDQLVIVEHGNEDMEIFVKSSEEPFVQTFQSAGPSHSGFISWREDVFRFKEVNQGEKTACVFAKHCGEAGA